jgi:hypothetical protein
VKVVLSGVSCGNVSPFEDVIGVGGSGRGADTAKDFGCYQPHRRKKAHDREVVTTAIGALIQHDASNACSLKHSIYLTSYLLYSSNLIRIHFKNIT